MVTYAGVDLSYANGKVDYKALNAGTVNGHRVKFAMLRLGHGTSKDTMFDEHYKGCKEAGIYVGAYHWSYAVNLTEARAEADWAVKELSKYEIDYPVALDFEDEKNVLSKGLSRAQYTAICKTYLEKIRSANYYPMLYCNPNVIDNYINIGDLSAYDLWLAQYTSEGYQRQLGQIMWQFTVAGHPTLDYGKVGAVAGVSGQCDCNWAYEGYAAKIRGLGMNKPIVRYRVTGTKTLTEDKLDEANEQLKAMGFGVVVERI
ncbi:MAG: hypothetical protein K2O14_15580 [Oscillospiraceae bacterium]|nr:hypothetical protein [Oscillospiraceae bacterium]